jgi:hypothetical protein
MTEDKGRKRAIRSRMAKTGERYTAARRHVVKPRDEVRIEHLPQSDARLRENTGRGWREWLRILDGWGAKERRHGDVVDHLLDEYGVPGWWAQTITIGYERARGLRAKHQTLTGSFQVSTSKTFPISVGKLFKAFAEAPKRNRWLERGTLKARTTRMNRSIRFDFRDGTSRVAVFLEPKDRNRTTVTIQHEKLPDAGAVEEMRAFWKDRLTRLGEIVD